MKTLEEIFSEDEYDRLFPSHRETSHYSKLLLDTLSVKKGVWFKYGERTGMIKDVIFYRYLRSER